MAARQYYYAESLSQSTTTSSSYTDKVALTFTPDANSDYFIIWSAALNSNSGTSNVDARLFHDTSSTVLSEFIIEPKDTSDYESLGSIDQLSFGASPASQTISIEFRTAAGTGAIKNATIIAIKKDAADEYAESEGESTTNSSTFQDKATLTFTPASQGDYLVVSTSEWQDTGSSGRGQYRLLDDSSTARALADRDPEDSTNWYPHNTAILRNLTAASKTFKNQFRNNSGSGTGVGIRRSRILALRLDTLPDYFYGEQQTRATTTSTTYQDRVTLTDTPAAEDYFRLAVAIMDGNNTTLSNFFNFDQAGSLYESLFEPSIAGGIDGGCFATMTSSVYTASASSTTWKTQYRSETASTTTGIAASSIAILQLTEPEGTTGTIAVTLENATSNITGSATSGTIATALGDAASAITAVQTQSGSLATTLGNATSSITASATSGTIAVTLDNATSAIAATQTQSGTIAVTLVDATSAITALQTQSGTIVVILDNATSSITGHTTSGIIAVTLDNATADFSGTVVQQFTGAIVTTLDNTTSAISATQTQAGTLVTTLDAATSSISALQTLSGTIATLLNDSTFSGTGAQTQAGTLTTTLDDATSAISALQTQSGSLATTLGDATFSGAGEVPFVGVLDTALADFTMSAVGDTGSGAPAGGAFPYHPIMRPRRR